MTDDVLIGILSVFCALMLWMLKRQSDLIKMTTETGVRVEGLKESVDKLDTFRERLAIVEGKAEAAHKRMDTLNDIQ